MAAAKPENNPIKHLIENYRNLQKYIFVLEGSKNSSLKANVKMFLDSYQLKNFQLHNIDSQKGLLSLFTPTPYGDFLKSVEKARGSLPVLEQKPEPKRKASIGN